MLFVGKDRGDDFLHLGRAQSLEHLVQLDGEHGGLVGNNGLRAGDDLVQELLDEALLFLSVEASGVLDAGFFNVREDKSQWLGLDCDWLHQRDLFAVWLKTEDLRLSWNFLKVTLMSISFSSCRTSTLGRSFSGMFIIGTMMVRDLSVTSRMRKLDRLPLSL